MTRETFRLKSRIESKIMVYIILPYLFINRSILHETQSLFSETYLYKPLPDFFSFILSPCFLFGGKDKTYAEISDYNSSNLPISEHCTCSPPIMTPFLASLSVTDPM